MEFGVQNRTGINAAGFLCYALLCQRFLPCANWTLDVSLDDVGYPEDGHMRLLCRRSPFESSSSARVHRRYRCYGEFCARAINSRSSSREPNNTAVSPDFQVSEN